MAHEEQSRLTPEDKALIRDIGTALRRIIQGGEPGHASSERRDELGILANMVNRVGRELYNSRLRDKRQRQELETRLRELREAQEAHERLMSTIEEISTPLLNIYEGVILLPVIGGMDNRRAQLMIGALLEAISSQQTQVLILDITGMPTIDTQVANVLVQSAQSALLLGARVILCGMTPDVAQVVVSLGIDLSIFQTCSDLQAALAAALRLTRHHIVTIQ